MSGGALTDGEAATGAPADIVVVGCVTVDDNLRGRCGEYPGREDAGRVGCAITGLPTAEKRLDEAGRTKPSMPCVKQAAANTIGIHVQGAIIALRTRVTNYATVVQRGARGRVTDGAVLRQFQR